MKLILGLFGLLLLIIIVGTYSKSLIFGNLGFNFGSTTVTIDKQTFKVEEAKSQDEQEAGLSGRDSLDKNSGMLFIFPKSGRYSFWMKNMKFPLDIIFISNNKITQISEDTQPPTKGTPDQEIQVISPNQDIDKVLEINAGLANKYHFKNGDSVSFSNL